MTGEPIPPPDAPFEVALTFAQLVTTFAQRRATGEDFIAMLVPAEHPDLPPFLVAFPKDGDADDRANILFLVAQVCPWRPTDSVLWATDLWSRWYEDEERSPDSPAPSEDPLAVEALGVSYARRQGADIEFWKSAWPYGYDDGGAFHWIERGPGWIDSTNDPMSRMDLAVMGLLFSDEELIANAEAHTRRN